MDITDTQQGKAIISSLKMAELDQRTTPFFWDCNCDDNSIHSKQSAWCPECGAKRDESPDSRVVEVVYALTVAPQMLA